MAKKNSKLGQPNPPTYDLKVDRDIAMDFAEKVYQKFDKMVKSVILFGSTQKKEKVIGSDIDIMIIIDDATVIFDDKMAMWYREELGKIIQENPYNKELHINTIRLTTWWDDLSRGDPTVINIIRYGETLIDNGGFFNPFKILLHQGKIKATPEAMYNILNRVPEHIARSKFSEMSAIEGCYWAMVESSQALLMSIKILPPSPEHIPKLLRQHFVDKKILKSYYVDYYESVFKTHKKILHGEIKDIDGRLVDDYQNKSEDFFKVVVKLINEIIK
ncbi:MAG: nucleotidyltransferase domain-containing protein [Candidatus Pacearchaeota archaeon]|jgi:predicted nucleotidyltransferase/uncharacterized protein (UPF0332 family)